MALYLGGKDHLRNVTQVYLYNRTRTSIERCTSPCTLTRYKTTNSWSFRSTEIL
jgi:hypothetical protein